MRITKHFIQRFEERVGKFNLDYIKNVLKYGEELPKEFKGIYLSTFTEFKDSCFVVYEKFIFVFNQKKDSLITVVKIKQ